MKVIMVAAITVCGRISPTPLGSTLDRQRLEQLRLETDASLIGANTLRDSDPELKGKAVGRYDNRHRIVISASGNLPVAGKKFFSSPPPPLVFTGEKKRKNLTDLLGARASVFGLPRRENGLCLDTLLQKLAALGLTSLLVEGGGKLNHACLSQKIVDELYVTVAPLLSGDKGAATLVDGRQPLGMPFLTMELLDCHRQRTGELFLRYRLK